ncbi:MAG: hypothetical protein FD142_3183, partial [bacterium]
MAAVGRLCRVIEGRGRVWLGVGFRRVGERIGQLRRGLGSRRVERGSRSSGETSNWGSRVVGGSGDRGSVGWAHILRLVLGPRATRLPLGRRVLRLLDAVVAASRGLRVGWGWLGWAGRSSEGPGCLTTGHDLQGTLFSGAAGGLIQYQRWAGHVAWSTSTTLIRGDAVEGLGGYAGVARGDRRKRR